MAYEVHFDGMCLLADHKKLPTIHAASARGTQNAHIGTARALIGIEQRTVQIGGSVRGYHELRTPLAALRLRLQSTG